MIQQPLGRPAALIDDAALDAVRVVWASARLSFSLVPLTRRGFDADSAVLPFPCCFAAGAAAVEGGEGGGDEKKEGEEVLHCGGDRGVGWGDKEETITCYPW